MTHWWEHERFDVADTFRWRLVFSLLGVEAFFEIMISAWTGHKGWVEVGFVQYTLWVVIIFAISARRIHLDQQAIRARWDDEQENP